jgi:hypothetical protein
MNDLVWPRTKVSLSASVVRKVSRRRLHFVKKSKADEDTVGKPSERSRKLWHWKAGGRAVSICLFAPSETVDH